MAQALFDALYGVGIDSLTALTLHFLLGSPPGAPTTFSANGGVAEDEDLFQCGKCKEQFSSFSEFFSHKKTHYSVQLDGVSSKGNETNSLIFSEIVPEQEFQQPITLSDSEFLSLGIDQGPLHVTNTSQVLDGCEAYLSNTTNQQQATFQVPATISSSDVTLSTDIETIREEHMKKDLHGTSMIKVSVIGSVPEQISGDVRSEEISKDQDNSSGKFKCDYCGKSFTKNFDLQQHVRSHTGERPYQCVVCGRAFAQKCNVKKHMATHKVWPKRIKTLSTDPLLISTQNNNGEENSKISSENFQDSVSENSNITDDTISKSYICQFCPALFKNYSELKSHRKEHVHQKVYRCIQKNCNETFSDLDIFLGHTKIHENEAHYHCHVCSKEFKSLDELGTHQQYSHSVPTNKLAPRIVYCKKCKSKFTNQEGLDRHMVLESHNYPCPRCTKVFPCERFLRRHLSTHSTTLPYTCQHCSKGFKTEHYLNMHIVIHSNEKPFTCQFCPAAFNRRDQLARHKLTHENIRKFKCPFSKHLSCTKAFNRKDKLKAHMLTHSGKLRYLCKNCGQIFQKQGSLMQHEKICTQKRLEETSSNSVMSTTIEDNSDSSNKIEVRGDNMSTIEIVVVPVTGKQKRKKKSGTFRVTFPAAKPTPVLLDHSQTILTQDQEVPVYKPNVNVNSNS